MPVDHYENFPVASWLVPARLRRPIELIYHFARSADDFADEGRRPDAERLALLAAYHEELDRVARDEPPIQPLFAELGPMIRERGLPLQLFHDLLDAFEQDVVKKRYADFGEVIHYCRRSANPVGRLVLHLVGVTDTRSLAQSDGICSALQIINFLQDVAVDYGIGRIYMPQDELARFGVTEEQIAEGRADARWRSFMRFQIERSRKMLQAGAPLGLVLKGRMGIEIRATIFGGERILKKLHDADGDMFKARPVLTAADWIYMLRRAIFVRRRAPVPASEAPL